MKLTGFVFGIRVDKSFSIEDKLGSIIDDILNHRNESFNSDKFPRVKQSFGVRVLMNEHNGNQIKITPEGIIIEYNVQEDFEPEFLEILDSFEQIIVSDIFGDYKIRNINRIGFVIKSRIEKKDNFLEGVFDTIIKNYDEPETFAIRFNTTKKTPQKIDNIVTQDYENLILTYDRPDKDQYFVFSADYQKHFVPALNIIEDLKKSFESSFTRFCHKSLDDFKNKYLENGEEERKKEG